MKFSYVTQAPLDFAAIILACDLLDGLQTSSDQFIGAPLCSPFLGFFGAALPFQPRPLLSLISVLPSVNLARLTQSPSFLSLLLAAPLLPFLLSAPIFVPNASSAHGLAIAASFPFCRGLFLRLCSLRLLLPFASGRLLALLLLLSPQLLFLKFDLGGPPFFFGLAARFLGHLQRQFLFA